MQRLCYIALLLTSLALVTLVVIRIHFSGHAIAVRLAEKVHHGMTTDDVSEVVGRVVDDDRIKENGIGVWRIGRNHGVLVFFAPCDDEGIRRVHSVLPVCNPPCGDRDISELLGTSRRYAR